MEDRCEICPRPRMEGGSLCPYHQLAYERLKAAFEIWKRALNMGWRQFLEEILKLSDLGLWAREVAESLLKEG